MSELLTPQTLKAIGISVAFIAGIGVVLAAMLLVAERLFLNYGDCEIDINDGDKKLTVKGGSTLLSSLAENNLFIPSACGGRGTCAYCKLRVLEGGGHVGPTEEPNLTPDELKQNVRLSCQVKVRTNMKLFVPRHLFSARRFSGVVERKRLLTSDLVELRIALKEPAHIDFTAGQYIQLELPAYRDREAVQRAYSIASVPSDQAHVELIVKKVPEGIATTWIFNYCKEGSSIGIAGPFGDFQLSPTAAPAIFMAVGSGMAPLWCMLRHMSATTDQRPVTYFYGARTQKDLIYADELRAIAAAHPWFTFVPVLSREPKDSGWAGERGHIPDAMARMFPDASRHEAYLCGSPAMVDSCVTSLTRVGMPASNIFFDKFA